MGEKIFCRNLEDNILYEYKIIEITKKSASLQKIFQNNPTVGAPIYRAPANTNYRAPTAQKSDSQMRQKQRDASAPLHIAWGICDFKTITKTLPMLNELGVQKISFVWCDRSQKGKELPLKKFKKILENSCEQSGRYTRMEREEIDSIEIFLQHYPTANICDFGGENFSQYLVNTKNGSSFPTNTFLIGPEGGFTENERKIFSDNQQKIFSFDTPLVLKSETAVVSVAAKFL